MFPHGKREPRAHGHSPGNGTTAARLSRTPLATEGEATPGPDDYNPYQDGAILAEDPTAGDDPYAFDDVAAGVGTIELPTMEQFGEGPRF